MRHLLHIFLLLLTAFFGISCQDMPTPYELARWKGQQPFFGQQPRQEVLVQKGSGRDDLSRTDGGIRFREGTLTEAPSLCRTLCPAEERAQTRSGERTSPTFRGGGKAFVACHTPRSSIHQVFGGFVQRTTVPIRSFASHVALFYVLRHIIR